LGDIVWTEDCEFGCIHCFHFAEDVILPEYARWAPATGTASTVCATTSRAAAKSGRARAYHFGSPSVIRVL
jgi:hypothetical protein